MINSLKNKLLTLQRSIAIKAVLLSCSAVTLIACIELDGSSSDNSEVENKADIQLKESKNQSELMQFLTASFTQKVSNTAYDDSYLEAIAVESEVNNSDTGEASDTEFSGTNTQVSGVDEGDIWKYDGENFFVLKPANWDYNSHLESDCPSIEPFAGVSIDITTPCTSQPNLVTSAQIHIVSNAKENLSNIDLDNMNPTEMYLSDDSLVVLGNKTQHQNNWLRSDNWQDGQSHMAIIDIHSKTEPEIKFSLAMDGYVVQSRRIGNELFLISRYSPQISGLDYYPETDAEVRANKRLISELAISDLLPKLTINDQQFNLVADNDCLIPQVSDPSMGSASLTMITKINIDSAEFSSRCMAGDVHGIYMSPNNLYTFNTSYWDFSDNTTESLHWNEGNTHLHKFELDSFDYQGSALVEGQLASNNPRLRLGELSDGSIALVTSKKASNNNWRLTQHQLTILNNQDDELNIIATLPNDEQPKAIGKINEQIYSVRFMQDRAYIVTFQKVDPLYVIDLSNPLQPIIAGELEIPGYSDYLHPIGNDLLLGVGKDAIVGESGTSWFQGVKVSLFDVADIEQPAELGNIIIGKRGSSTPLSYDPLSFAGIQQDGKYRFAFPIKVNNGPAQGDYWRDPESQKYQWSNSGLYLFEVKDKLLTQSGALVTKSVESDNSDGYHNINSNRGLIQGDDVYHLSDRDLYKADWDHPEQMSEKF